MKDLGLTLKWIIDNLEFVSLGQQLSADSGQLVQGISTDSRNFKPGEIFVALKGDKFDGHDYLDSVLAHKALAVVVEKDIDGPVATRAIKVNSTLKALGQMASAVCRRQNLQVMAVTGSNGKTTTKEMLAAIMIKSDPDLLVTEGNFNNQIGLPLTIFKVKALAHKAVLEMGANHFGEIADLCKIAEPDLAMITSAGKAHLEYFKTVERVAQAKGEIYAGLKPSGTAVINIDESLLVAQGEKFSGNKVTFGSHKTADIRLGQIKDFGLDGQEIMIYGPGAEKGQSIKLNLLGFHNAHNALAASAMAQAAGASWDQIVDGLLSVKGIKGRLQVLDGIKGFRIIDDSYNANPTSMAAGLRFLASLKSKGQKAALLGDMGELGADEMEFHREIGRLVSELKIDYLAAVGPLSQFAAEAAEDAGLNSASIGTFETPEPAAQWLAKELANESVILVKGSRSAKLERAFPGLIG